MNPFDFVNDINFKKKNIMTDTDNDELAEKSYVPYLTNKALSYFPDTVFYSNQMNFTPHLDHRLQYEYLLNSIRPKKRFSKWVKSEDNNEVEMIKIYYGYSHKKAEQAASVLSSKQIKIITDKVCGGITDESGSG